MNNEWTKWSMGLSAVALLGLVACGDAGGDASPGVEGERGAVSSVVPAGKADDYFSTEGREYTITGETFAVVDAGCMADEDASDERCALQAAGLKNFAIAWILNQYVIDKHDSANEDWGGFTAMTRPESYEAIKTGDIGEDGRFEYTFTSELSGPMDLLDVMPLDRCDTPQGTVACFKLEVPVLDHDTLSKMETGSEWYRQAPFKAYDPATYTGEKETLELTISAYPRSNDAFLEYGKLFSPAQLAKAGGKLRIGVFVGWDYYDGRYDLQTAREVYRWLTRSQGFKSPVASYDDYKIDSGEMTRSIQVQGETVEVEVKLVHPGQGDPADPVFAGEMKEAMIKAFGERQIIIYEGHAGPLYGFALGNWRQTEAGELDDSELPLLDIPSDFYQIVLSSGCDTYMVADSLYKVPAKAGRVDLDVITTNSFSNAAGRGRTAKALMSAVINQQDRGQLRPVTYGDLLRELNREWTFTPIYGVHGIDDNPRANPFADVTALCEPCQATDECGGQGNTCLKLNDAESVCGVTCKTDEDCPQDYACFKIADGDTIHDAQCAPRDLTCR